MKKTINITGTHCKACKALIEDICSEVQGVISCEVDYKTGKTDIEYDDRLNWINLKNEIEAAGNYKIQL